MLGVLSKHPPAELYVQVMAGFDGKGVSLVNEDKESGTRKSAATLSVVN